jgi:diphthamide synthase (EF-2-diphthine--ammonia ligase)
MGRKVDHSFVADVKKVKSGVDLCGETGEYHTFVVNGPLFRERVNVAFGQKVFRDGYWFHDLEEKA